MIDRETAGVALCILLIVTHILVAWLGYVTGKAIGELGKCYRPNKDDK